ncbi:hypothetical protein EV183_004213 [Coemansia sp. RSA 2336]|nr:hypothetical protein EV183_004213 [Coemansia sp. RSA 2336]
MEEGMRSSARPWTHTQAGSPRSMHPIRMPNGRTSAAHNSLAALEAKTPIQQHIRNDGEDKWRRLGARILPVFTGERLHCTIEECNEVVRSCLRSSEQLEQVWPEIHGILRMGMTSVVRILYRQVNMTPKYENRTNSAAGVLAMPSAALLCESVRADMAVEALAFVWEMVNSHVVPYIEGVFLPLVQFGIAAASSGNPAKLSVRNAVLLHFRDNVVVPLLPSLDEVVNMARAQISLSCLPALVHMLTMLTALRPTDRGQFYLTAKALSSLLQA